MCCYLLNRLLGAQCPLVKALDELSVTIDNNCSSLSGQMVTSHWCMALAYNVSCVFNSCLNVCIKASATADTSDMVGRIPASL